MIKVPFVHDTRHYKRDPNVYVKNEFNPFGKYGSKVWLTWYFRSVGRGRARYYESYGRSEAEARRGLEKAISKKVEGISKQVWRKGKV